MEERHRAFIEFALHRGALRFGSFTLKSGRESPYFFNTGLFDTGTTLARLGSFYAGAIAASGIRFDLLYGPAYKGIPLVAAVAIAMATEHGREVPLCFNRKEAKDHGEGGLTVGAPLEGRVLIVDDVISAGISVRESVEIIRGAGARPVGVAISLDRQERGLAERSAVQEVEGHLGLPVLSVVTLAHLIDYLEEVGSAGTQLEALRSYRDRYGV